MLDLSSTKSIYSNHLLAKQFIKYISAFELLTVIDEANKKGDLILNNQSIIDGILDSNDEGKLLLLASGSKLDEFARSDKFLTLYNKGDFLSQLCLEIVSMIGMVYLYGIVKY